MTLDEVHKQLCDEHVQLEMSHRKALDKIALLEAQVQGARRSLESMREAMVEAMVEQAKEYEAAELPLRLKTDAILEGCTDGNAVPALAVLYLETAARHRGQRDALRVQAAVAKRMLTEPEFRES